MITFQNTTLANIVEVACQAQNNTFGYGIWTHHILYVAHYGNVLADKLNADNNIVEIAALLHDYASITDIVLAKDHHIHGPLVAEKLLRDLDYPEITITAVKHCIASHRGSVAIEKETPEAICLASADAMAHISQVASLLYLAFAQRHMAIDEGTKWVREKLERSWQKLCPEGRSMIEGQYQAALIMLQAGDI